MMTVWRLLLHFSQPATVPPGRKTKDRAIVLCVAFIVFLLGRAQSALNCICVTCRLVTYTQNKAWYMEVLTLVFHRQHLSSHRKVASPQDKTGFQLEYQYNHPKIHSRPDGFSLTNFHPEPFVHRQLLSSCTGREKQVTDSLEGRRWNENF